MWKMNNSGTIETLEGNPVWIDDNGGETAVDYSGMAKELANVKTAYSKAHSELQRAKVTAMFATSPYACEVGNTALLAELFAKNYIIDDEGNISATDKNGQKIYTANGIAGFDDALKRLIAESPYKDAILAGKSKQGGAQGRNGSKTISRADFDQLQPRQRVQHMKDGFVVVD